MVGERGCDDGRMREGHGRVAIKELGTRGQTCDVTKQGGKKAGGGGRFASVGVPAREWVDGTDLVEGLVDVHGRHVDVDVDGVVDG